MVTSPQRAYTAACPNCGAPVEFVSASSLSAVCGFCRSTLVRDGEALRRIGSSAELFDDHSPLQLGVRGSRQGVGFTLVGRLQYSYAGGTWNEWHALLEQPGQDAQAPRSAWLSEDNGAYVLAFDAPTPGDAPTDEAALNALQAGQRMLAAGRAWDVASVQRATLTAAEGELPLPPRLDREFTVVDLRNSVGEVATLDSLQPARIGWSVGRSVLLSELALSGLRDENQKNLNGRSLQCPNCGTALNLSLENTQSIVCHNCRSVVDVSAGVGGDLAHYQQKGRPRREPAIPMGSSGSLALGGPAVTWQVVGFQERCDIPTDGEEDTSYWREYLLFNRELGFAFLVDTDEGWSWVKPLTGVPVLRGDTVQWKEVTYRKKWDYQAKVTWVEGEFYWRVLRGQRAHVTDYEGQGKFSEARLSREETRSSSDDKKSGTEVTWSAGRTLSAATLVNAFGLSNGAALQRDVAPLSAMPDGKRANKTIFWLVLALIVIMVLLNLTSGNDCNDVRSTFGAASTEYAQCQQNLRSGGSGFRTGGGSYGGWSSGGGHK